MKETPGSMADANVFLGGAQKGFYDAHSLVLNEGEFSLRDVPNGVQLVAVVPAAVLERDYPQVTPELMGKVSLVGQGIETPEGKPITIDTDILRRPRPAGRQLPGPLGSLRAGTNEVIVWRAN